MAQINTEKQTTSDSHESLKGESVIIAEVMEQLDTRLPTPQLSEDQRDAIARYAMGQLEHLERTTEKTDMFDKVDQAMDWLGTLSNGGPQSDRAITVPHQQALKYFSGVLFETIRRREVEGDEQSAQQLAAVAHQAYFSVSPNIAVYTGGLSGMAELVSYGNRSVAVGQLVQRIEGEVIYNGAFATSESLFDEDIAKRSPKAQIELINTVARLATQVDNWGSWAHPFAGKVLNGFRNLIKEREGITPFIRTIVGAKGDEIYDALNQEWVSLDELPLSQQQKLLESDGLRREQYAQLQTELHEAFPGAENDAQLVLIAPDVVGIGRDVREILTKDGKRVCLADITQRNDLAISAQDAVLLRAIHEAGTRNAVEDRLGISLHTLPLTVQQRLISFMIEAGDERYDRLTTVLENYSGDRAQLAQSFLATEFGADYGDKILSIAEHADSKQSAEIFETINGFRDYSHRIAQWYEAFDPNLAQATEQAMNERLTDALYAVEQLVREGRLEVDTAPHRGNDDYQNDGRFMMKLESVHEGLAILKNLEKALHLQYEVVTAPDTYVTRVVEDNEQFMIYRFSSETHGDALLYVRPEGAKGYDRNFEYGNRKGVEASISFIVNPTDPHHLRSDKDPHGVSIRFDREGRLATDAPSDENRDPTRSDGLISLDISSGLGDGRTTPVQIGRFIASGNIIRAEATGGAVHLHHNTNHFDQSIYGTSGGFARFAVYIQTLAETMIRVQEGYPHVPKYHLRHTVDAAMLKSVA